MPATTEGGARVRVRAAARMLPDPTEEEDPGVRLAATVLRELLAIAQPV